MLLNVNKSENEGKYQRCNISRVNENNCSPSLNMFYKLNSNELVLNKLGVNFVEFNIKYESSPNNGYTYLITCYVHRTRIEQVTGAYNFSA